MPVRTGDVRLLRGVAAPQGWDPVCFFFAEAGTALYVINVDDEEWSW